MKDVGEIIKKANELKDSKKANWVIQNFDPNKQYFIQSKN